MPLFIPFTPESLGRQDLGASLRTQRSREVGKPRVHRESGQRATFLPSLPSGGSAAGDEGGDNELEGRVRPAPELLLLIQEWETTREVSTPRIQGNTGPWDGSVTSSVLIQ